MAESDHITSIRALQTTDDAAAAAMASSETHAELLKAVIATPRTEIGPKHLTLNMNRQPLLAIGAVITAVALVVFLPGVLSGGGTATQPPPAQATILARVAAALAPRQGTVMVEVRTERLLEGGAFAGGSKSIQLRTITETSKTGHEQRVFAVASDLRRGYQLVLSRNSAEIYEPSTNTICTARAHLQLTGLSFQPSDTTLFAQELHAHLYRVRGRSMVSGKPALKLAPVRRRIRVGKFGYRLLPTVYVSPRTYYPIRAVLTAPPAERRTAVVNWLVFRVLPATATNKRLLSLTARHPAARVVSNRAACARIADAARKP